MLRSETNTCQRASAKITFGLENPAFVEHLASPLVALRPVELRLVPSKALCHGVARLSFRPGHLSTACRRLTKPPPCWTFPPTMAPGSSRFLRPARRRNETDPRCQQIQKSLPTVSEALA
ncbi:hypothetical protein MPLDJ20_170030 [Mesorhizobium plurifarium]|uniref:Uncharacterized protein n=1 Tax=Mesorhizobium plurifarium TaxID=69974 RepID=A0A090ER59_MESPL|nr:hypothetical protein MPLDJ20_170030 [Mesorhizobium plurifarium]